MLKHLLVALLTIILMTVAAVGQTKDRPPVAVPDLSGFANGDEMLGFLSTFGIQGRIGAERPAPTEELQGKFGQDPAPGTMLDPDTGRVTIFRYGAYVAPADPKTDGPGGMDTVIAGPEAEFVGNFAGTMNMGGTETPITVGISNSAGWSLVVGTGNGIIGGSTRAPSETTSMADGVLTYHLTMKGSETTLSVKVSGDDLTGEMVSVLGSTRTNATLSARRVK